MNKDITITMKLKSNKFLSTGVGEEVIFSVVENQLKVYSDKQVYMDSPLEQVRLISADSRAGNGIYNIVLRQGSNKLELLLHASKDQDIREMTKQDIFNAQFVKDLPQLLGQQGADVATVEHSRKIGTLFATIVVLLIMCLIISQLARIL